MREITCVLCVCVCVCVCVCAFVYACACTCRSENIAQAMVVRGFQGPDNQRLYMLQANEKSVAANILALLALAGFFAAGQYIK